MKKLLFPILLLFVITNNSIAQKTDTVKVNGTTYSIETSSYDTAKTTHTSLTIRNLSDSLRLLKEFYDDNKRLYNTSGATYRNYNSVSTIVMETLSSKIKKILNTTTDLHEHIILFSFWFDTNGSVKEIGFTYNSQFKDLITISDLDQIGKKIKASDFGLNLEIRPELTNTRWIYGSSLWKKQSFEKDIQDK